MMETIAQIIGMLGVVIVLVAYWLLASGKLSHRDVRYPWLNIVGTAGILYSLLTQWNLPSIVAQVLWILLSVAALIRIRMGKA
ncbi:MAG: cyclic nucleotide-binding protein [Alphaproteobacteria bacterium]